MRPPTYVSEHLALICPTLPIRMVLCPSPRTEYLFRLYTGKLPHAYALNSRVGPKIPTEDCTALLKTTASGHVDEEANVSGSTVLTGRERETVGRPLKQVK